jgi:hypothetical protein
MQTAIYSYLHTLPRTQIGDLEAVKVGKIGIEQAEEPCWKDWNCWKRTAFKSSPIHQRSQVVAEALPGMCMAHGWLLAVLDGRVHWSFASRMIQFVATQRDGRHVLPWSGINNGETSEYNLMRDIHGDNWIKKIQRMTGRSCCAKSRRHWSHHRRSQVSVAAACRACAWFMFSLAVVAGRPNKQWREQNLRRDGHEVDWTDIIRELCGFRSGRAHLRG